jgi:predicted DNA-binding transcriptional regulator YafY
MHDFRRAARLAEPFDMRIEYRDAKGQTLYRDVTLHGVEEIAPEVFQLDAFCHLRKQPRTFRTDRIVSIITPDGEVREPRDLVATLLAGFAPDAPGKRSPRLIRLALILFAIAAAMVALALSV